MKQRTVVKNMRIVPMPVMNCLNANSSDVNFSSDVFVSINEQMIEQGERMDLSAEIALDKILKDYDRAWKTLGNA